MKIYQKRKTKNKQNDKYKSYIDWSRDEISQIAIEILFDSYKWWFYVTIDLWIENIAQSH